MWKWPGPEVRVRASTLGLLALSGLVVFAVLFGDPNRKVGAILYDWQGLEAGLLALVAAVISLAGPRAQIAQADALEAARRKREETAARALLPIALDTVATYVNNCMRIVVKKNGLQPHARGSMGFGTLDVQALLTLREVASSAPEPFCSRAGALIQALQVVNANGLSAIPLSPFYAMAVRVIKARRLCDSLFPYARGEEDADTVDPCAADLTADYIRKSIIMFRGDVEDFVGLSEHLAHMRERES